MSDKGQIDESIENVGNSVWGYFKRHPLYIIIPIIIAVIAEFLLFYYFREISFYPPLIPLLTYAYIKNKIQLCYGYYERRIQPSSYFIIYV